MHHVAKEMNIAIAHRLSLHPGKCRKLHGHNLKVVVTISSEKSPGINGMTVDFYNLKQIMEDVVGRYDHCTLLNQSDDMLKDFELFDKYADIHVFPFEPTCENLSKFIFDEISKKINNMNQYMLEVASVKIYESDTSFAEYM